MRLHVLSDLHMEFAPFMAPLTGADAVILAGDISTGVKGFKWALTTFTNCPVIYVLGNHEFYGQKLQKLFEQLKEMAKGTNIQILENGVFTFGDVTFLGATLWERCPLYRLCPECACEATRPDDEGKGLRQSFPGCG